MAQIELATNVLSAFMNEWLQKNIDQSLCVRSFHFRSFPIRAYSAEQQQRQQQQQKKNNEAIAVRK